ncbi:MAG: helix-turn-helix domain-containing protein [Eubacterium sp.]|nr:helix-turn-helix domain-containing protein [Eubacterium sp.]MCM1216716.1 helix-turn-helix domain-containing protein [Lachnospiraceae bacterium]MCM1303063.1 helix-turn-helix domain-containing protein [Butyrivibrio sp.]MCM1343384.1 helix-turn-helix domain-containing protein [Muribaculaceae bacterium]MCM1238764.1 helix-turn-helix domain-containing protein [Lachnospiraceae bacterium]
MSDGNRNTHLLPKATYDRLAVGERIRLKRTLSGLTQEAMARRIDRAPKYYADIERGSCGMSVETLMAISASLAMPLDYIIYGKSLSDRGQEQHTEEVAVIESMLDNADAQTRKHALDMLKLLLEVCPGL